MKKELVFLFIFIAVSSGVTSGRAKSDYSVTCEEIGQINTGGGAFAITISDNYAYVCDITTNLGGLFIFDISDPTDPIKMSRFYDGGLAQEVAVRDDIAYVADQSDGLEILNVSDPSDPVKIGSYKVADMYTTSVKVFGDFAFIGDVHHGLIKLNITNLSKPVKITSCPYSCPTLELSAGFIVGVNHNHGGLEIRDLENLDKLGTYSSLGADLIYCVLQQNLIFSTNHQKDTGEVHIINISDTNNPILVSKYNGSDIAHKCFVNEDLLYVPCSTAGIEIVDISNPTQPKKIGSYSDNSGVAFNLYVQDNIAFVADGSDGLEIVKMTIKENSKDINGYSFIGCILAVLFIKGIKKSKRNPRNSM
ncbi:MAG: LVIVD repeat-containing protein [Promethearchaeota archaeon]